MAEAYISELGDSLSHGVANTNGDRVKIIAPKLYNDGNGNHPSIATALSGKAASSHTHTTSIASDSSSGTVVTLAQNTQYKLTAGGTSVLFKTPADSNTDTKVTQTKDDSGTTAYPLLMAGAADPNGTATTARYDSAVKLTPSTNTISANISGNAATATSAGKLTTGRELAVSLSNTSTTTTFDGSANVTNIKVSGQLPVVNGGTGSNTAAGARTNLSVYSKSEIDSLMSGRVEIVTELPATGKSGVTYYVGPTGSGADKYDEYLWTGSAFLKVGEHSLDLSNYVNTVNTSGSGSVVTGVSKSGNTVTVTKGNISLDDLSDWATETDVTISNVTYHTMWPVAPTSSNQVYGISINGGRLFRIYNNKGAYSVQAYDKDSDTTYTPQKLGSGYGTCTTAEATAAKVVTLADYVLAKNGIVAVKFSYPLCASATLNINGKGAKPVYVGGAAVTATNCKSVQAGDIGYFIYDGTAYHFLGTDRADKSAITGLSVSGKTVTYTRADGETGTFDTQDTTYSFADSYNASTNKGATVATVTNAINALDVTGISGFGAGKTLATLKEENGKISATFQNISITKSQVSDFSHTHGNIQNGGTLQTNDITIANGDKLVVTDSSDSSKVARASISFDGSTTTQALTKAGTWATFNNYSLPLAANGTRGGIQIGYSESGTNYAVKLSSEKAYVTVPWTDTKVTQTADTSASSFPILAKNTTATSTITDTSRFADGVTVTPNTKTINASYINAISDRAYTSYTGGTGKVTNDTRWMWVCRLKGIAYGSYNTVSLLFNNEFWNTQQANVFILNFAYGRNGGQGTTVSVSCNLVMLMQKNTDIEFKFLRNPSDTAADNTIDVYIRVSASGTSYGGWYAKVLNSDSQRISSIIEWKWQFNQTLPEGAENIPLGGSVNYAASASAAATGSALETAINGKASSTHTHGNIANGGTLQTNDITIASGDKLVVTDSSDSNKVARTSVSFDGSTTTKALTPKGTWETFNNYSLPLAASGTRGGIQIGYSESGTNYAVKLSSEKAYVTVPWTDTKVTQTADDASTGTGFELLFSSTGDNTTRTEASRKSSKLTYQPSTGTLKSTAYNVNSKCTLQFNTTTNALDFVFT